MAGVITFFFAFLLMRYVYRRIKREEQKRAYEKQRKRAQGQGQGKDKGKPRDKGTTRVKAITGDSLLAKSAETGNHK